MASDVETRSAPAAEPKGQSRTVGGYAIRADEETVIGEMFRERISVGAIRGAVKDADICALLHHDGGRLIGRTSSGTLRLKADAYGLRFEVDLPNSSDGDTAIELIRRRDVVGCSFGFRAISETWEDGDGKLPLRTINEMQIVEVSLVTWPAYPTTSVALRGLAAHRKGITNAARRARMKMRLEQSIRGICA